MVVRAARVAPDGAARNQALALLAVLARSHPQATLQHVVDVSRCRECDATLLPCAVMLVMSRTVSSAEGRLQMCEVLRTGGGCCGERCSGA